jgi:hypothetical protein
MTKHPAASRTDKIVQSDAAWRAPLSPAGAN